VWLASKISLSVSCVCGTQAIGTRRRFFKLFPMSKDEFSK
jgi:hypothetical protein